MRQPCYIPTEDGVLNFTLVIKWLTAAFIRFFAPSLDIPRSRYPLQKSPIMNLRGTTTATATTIMRREFSAAAAAAFLAGRFGR